MSSPSRRHIVSFNGPDGLLPSFRTGQQRSPRHAARIAGTEAGQPGAACGGLDLAPALRAIFDNGTAGIAETDVASSRFVRVNRRYCETIGRTEADLLGGLGPADVLHPDDRDAMQRWRAAEAGCASWDSELRYLRPDGTVVWCRVSVAASARDSQGRPERVLVIMQDITEARLASERLRASEARLRVGMEIGHLGTYRYDLVSGHIQCGPETRALHGLADGDAPIPAAIWLATMLPGDRERVQATIADALAGHLPVSDFHYRVGAPSIGMVRHLEARARLDFDAAGRPLGAIVAVIDVTASREAEALLHLCLEVSRVGWFRRDFATNTFQCGPETRAMRYLPPDDAPVSMQDWFESVLPEDRAPLLAQISRSQARGDLESSMSYRIRDPTSGRLHHHDTRWRFGYGPDGRCLSAIGALVDVTEQREAEAMLRLALEIGRVGTFRHDHVAQVFECCPVTRAIFGLPADQAPVPAQTWFGFLLPDDRERFVGGIAAVVARRDSEDARSFRIRNPVDGKVRHIELRVRIEYDDGGRCLHALGVLIDVTERREAEARIAHLAHHDVITGLPNRQLFGQRLDEALTGARRGRGFALLLVDLDHFKEVNDSLGHPAGDALLRAVTRRIQPELRESDTVARLGGDEFAIIEADVQRPEDVTALARRLVELLGMPFDIGGQQVIIGSSIGIVMAPMDGLDADGLLKGADMALYLAKAEGRGCWRFFEPEMDARMQLRRSLECDLRRALAAGEFELFYQPQVEVRTRRVSGLEALLRWRHPERGLIPPDAFIPLAEDNGLITPIGAWVLTRACTEATSWPGVAKVAVNLSPVQFASRGLVEAVAVALEMSGLDPARLELEITEKVLLRESKATLATLQRLKALGVRLAMDDFGTGYSSLNYLQVFPFDRVKIDRCFISELEQSRQSKAIVRAVVDLCAGLDMTTTAEGVETETQLQILARAGCGEAQGYLFSQPLPAHEIPALLKRLEADGCVTCK